MGFGALMPLISALTTRIRAFPGRYAGRLRIYKQIAASIFQTFLTNSHLLALLTLKTPNAVISSPAHHRIDVL
jgi:hypothetical protein